jgi:hypothetical protein
LLPASLWSGQLKKEESCLSETYLTLNGLHLAMYQKTELFTTNAVGTSNPTDDKADFRLIVHFFAGLAFQTERLHKFSYTSFTFVVRIVQDNSFYDVGRKRVESRLNHIPVQSFKTSTYHASSKAPMLGRSRRRKKDLNVSTPMFEFFYMSHLLVNFCSDKLGKNILLQVDIESRSFTISKFYELENLRSYRT